MYILSGNCGYCARYCSRDNDLNTKSSVPFLNTPQLPYIKAHIVCQICYDKIDKGMSKLIESFVYEKED